MRKTSFRPKHLPQSRLDLFEGCGIVWSQQPVVGDDEQFILEEPYAAFETRLGLDQRSSVKRSLQACAQRLFEVPAGCLRKYDKPRISFSHIRAEIPLMSDQQDAGPVVDMAVVVDVDQLMLLHRTASESTNGKSERSPSLRTAPGSVCEKLDTES